MNLPQWISAFLIFTLVPMLRHMPTRGRVIYAAGGVLWLSSLVLFGVRSAGLVAVVFLVVATSSLPRDLLVPSAIRQLRGTNAAIWLALFLGLVASSCQVGMVDQLHQHQRAAVHKATFEQFENPGNTATPTQAQAIEALAQRVQLRKFLVILVCPLCFAILSGLMAGRRTVLFGILTCWTEPFAFARCMATMALVSGGAFLFLMGIGLVLTIIHGSIGGLIAALLLGMARRRRSSHQQQHNNALLSDAVNRARER